MKRVLCVLLALVLALSVLSGCSQSADVNTEQDNNFSLAAIDFIKGIKVGWNLGNTLEAYSLWGGVPEDNPTVEQVECGWNNPRTTQAMINKVADAGFNAVRLPITWGNFVTEQDGVYGIKPEWMSRVREIVGYAQNRNMYVIVDMHHDDKTWLDLAAEEDDWAKQLEQYNAMWTIIANEFRDDGERLILEAVNEPLGSNLDGSQDWWGQADAFVRLNALYKSFVDTVRATGGNNERRYLMLPTYGAQWYEHQLSNLEIPNNDDHLIVDVHCYKEDADEAELAQIFDTIKRCTLDYKIAMIMGETGIRNARSEYDKIAWSARYIKQAAERGIRCLLWDDGGDFQVLNRNTLAWNSPAFIDAVIKDAAADTQETTEQETTEEPTEEDEYDGVTVAAPTTEAINYKATDEVYYSWGSSAYSKTEGWMSGAKNLDPANFSVTAGALSYNLTDFKSSQLNSAWQCGSDKQAMAAALASAKSGSGKLVFTVSVLSCLDENGDATSVQFKTNLGGGYTGDNDYIINSGGKRQIAIDVSSLSEPSDFVFMFMNFTDNLTELKLLISSISVAELA